MFSYSTGYYVSPPDDQYLKFKNRCSLVYSMVHLVWEGGGGQREGTVEGQQYTSTSIVPSAMGVTVHNLGRKYKLVSECISSL